ncbi:MAG: hypothetical protein AB7V36_03120 [Bacteroidales bacterium]|jgi:hypothetical protein|nr:hypothetical protein [Bacteroidales bacterium]HPB02119.1 hypothetical protein [Bacteroidales bacterium]HPF00754.1 hypothetical protein [Bacteroidales bacterium]
MKKILLVSVFFVICLAMSAQQTKHVEKIRILETGTAVLNNGQCQISLNEEIDPANYYIVLTPVGKPAVLYIANQESKQFVVKSDVETTAEFQYMVIEKRRKEVLDTNNTKSGK